MPWHFKIDDPSGNSHVQNPHAPANDVYCTIKHYERTQKEIEDMGFAIPESVEEEKKEVKAKEDGEKDLKKPDFTPEEVEEMMKKAQKVDAKKKERQYEKTKEKDNLENEVF